MAHETTALLARVPTDPDDEHQDFRTSPATVVDDDRIPKLQLGLLCFGRAMDGLAYFVVFPFINEMISKIPGVRRSDTGFWSGILEALFALTQIVCMTFCSRITSRFSKKRVVSTSMVGMAVATALFGFGSRLWHLILARFVAGVFSSTAPAMRMLFYELSTPKTEARIFSLYPLANNMGMFFGPIIGGFLADPAERFPTTFGRFQLFRDYPYALPTCVAGLAIFCGSMTTALFVTEASAKSKETKNTREYSFLELIKERDVAVTLFVYGITLFLGIGYSAVLPALMFTRIDQGGFNLPPSRISLFIALSGFTQAMWSIFAYPPLDRRMNRVRLIRSCYCLWPTLFFLGPLCNVLLKRHLEIAFWIVFPTVLTLGNNIAIVFSGTGVLLNNVSPSTQALEKLNTIALSTISVSRAASPAFFGAIYSAGVRTQLLWGQLVWLVFILLWMLPMGVLQFAPPRPRKENE